MRSSLPWLWLGMVSVSAVAWVAMQPEPTHHPARTEVPCEETPTPATLAVCDPGDLGPHVAAADAPVPIGLARAVIEAHLDDASREAGVAIRYIDHEEEIQAARGMLPAEAHRLPAALEAVLDALLYYPEEVRLDRVDEVQVFDTLYDGDTSWLGFANCRQRRIRVALYDKRNRRSITRTLHHEVGHLVWCADDELRAAWKALHRPPSRPAERSRRALREAGFLNAYAATNPTEDFAETWELFVTDVQRLDHLADRFPALAAKRDLLVHFDARLHAGWQPSVQAR